LTDYAYILKTGGKIYTVTDVEDLHNWQVDKLSEHPMFEMLTDEQNQGDICIEYMREGTDEAKKVIRREGQIWHAVFRKRDVNDASDKAAVTKKMMEAYFS